MMNRKWLIGVVVGAFACVCVVIAVSGRNAAIPNLTSSAIGAEPADKKPSTTVWEFGPARTKTNLALSEPVAAYREMKTGDASAFYGVQIGPGAILSIEAADDLIAFYEKYKKSGKSKAKEVESAFVEWVGTVRGGGTVSIKRNLGEGKWNYMQLIILDDEFFAGIKAAIADVKALKDIPLSVNP